MNNKPKIYLAGPISGLAYNGAQDWRDEVSRLLWAIGLVGYSPLRAKGYLRGAGVIEQSYENHPLSTDRGITSRDRWDVMTCDAVLFNLLGATKRVSVGTCLEFGWADAFRKPIIVVMEPNLQNPHDHPMVREVTNFRVETLNEAVTLLDRIFNPQLDIKALNEAAAELGR